MVNCRVCVALEEPGHWRDTWIHEDNLVVLGHLPPSADAAADAYPGHLVLVPRRHVLSPAYLTVPEAERIGLWLSRGTRLLESLQGAEHVYMLRLGSGWPHLHFHLLPQYPGTPPEYRGMEVRDWPGAPRCDRSQMAAIAGRLRKAAATF